MNIEKTLVQARNSYTKLYVRMLRGRDSLVFCVPQLSPTEEFHPGLPVGILYPSLPLLPVLVTIPCYRLKTSECFH